MTPQWGNLTRYAVGQIRPDSGQPVCFSRRGQSRDDTEQHFLGWRAFVELYETDKCKLGGVSKG